MSIPDFASAGGFGGITGSDGPSASAFESLRASLQSEFTETTGGASATTTTASSEGASATANASATAASGPSSDISTTLATSTLPSEDITSPTATGPDSPTGTGENAASSTTGEAPTVSEKDSCNSISCNSGLQAAVAVPIVIAVLLIFALFFFARRRRRRREALPVSEKQTPAKKKWSRHLRVFSFDAELLMGGWRSSSNSIRSRQTGSVRSGESSNYRQSPSIHSADEVAPPYRDAITTAQRPITQTGAAGVTAPSPDPFSRPSSAATAPPPYAATLGNTSRQSNRPSTRARDPFADAAPISPIDGSPFDHPEDDDARSPTSPSQPMISRQSSMLRSINEDGGSTLAGSDGGSIREAQLGRNVSVMSGGRTIDNVRGSS